MWCIHNIFPVVECNVESCVGCNMSASSIVSSSVHNQHDDYRCIQMCLQYASHVHTYTHMLICIIKYREISPHSAVLQTGTPSKHHRIWRTELSVCLSICNALCTPPLLLACISNCEMICHANADTGLEQREGTCACSDGAHGWARWRRWFSCS